MPTLLRYADYGSVRRNTKLAVRIRGAEDAIVLLSNEPEDEEGEGRRVSSAR